MNIKIVSFILCAIFLLSACPVCVNAENRKGVIYRIKGTDNWAAAIKREYFQPYQARQPYDSKWCWAASAQMVLNYQGVKINQEKLVETVW